MLRVVLLDESADWKHILETASSTVKHLDKFEQGKEYKETKNHSCEFVLLESNHYVQARNILLLTVLSTTEGNFSRTSIINAFTALLYNIHLDEESFNIMKSALERYKLSIFV